MADFILESRVWLGHPRPDVFAFFSDPQNLARVTPPALGLRVLSAPPTLGAGAVRRLLFDCGTVAEVICPGRDGRFRYRRPRWAPGSS